MLEAGLVPVPIRYGEKRPIGSGWQDRRPTADDLDELFPPDENRNLGVLLGEASGRLIDVDCDSPEAVAAARMVLGAAKVKSRRGEDVTSHYWFTVVDGDEMPQTVRFTDPANPGDVLLELRSDGAQTVIAPSVHPDGSPYRWETPLVVDTEDGPKVNADEVSATGAMEMVRTVAAISMLGRHWPGKGSRHTAHLALCGALLRDPDTGKLSHWASDDSRLEDAEGLVRAVSIIGGDDEFYERGENLDTTRDAILNGEAVTGWTRLTEWMPGAVVWKARELLGLEPADPEADPEEDLTEWDDDVETVDEMFNLVALGEVMQGGIPEPVDLTGDGVLYAGEVTTIQSGGGKGKTLIALALLLKMVEQGRNVMFVDEENGPFEVGRRLVSLGADPQLVDRHLVYSSMPGVDWSANDSAARLATLCDERDIKLVLFDSTMDLLANTGLDENSNSDFNWLYKALVEKLKQKGVAVLLLDHLSKETTHQARGASAKFDQASVVWSVRTVSKFDAQHSGHVQLSRKKGRLAVITQAVDVMVRVNPAEGTTKLTFHKGGVDFKEVRAEDSIRDWLVENGHTSAETAVWRSEVADGSGVRKQDALDLMRDCDVPGLRFEQRGTARSGQPRIAVWAE